MISTFESERRRLALTPKRTYLHSMADLRRFVEEQCLTAFSIAFAGVAAAPLLLLAISNPVCGLGRPYPPHIASGVIVTPSSDDLTVIVHPGDLGVVADEVAPLSRFEETIDSALASGRYRRVIIEADRRTKYASLFPIFRAAREHRIPVAFVTEPESVLNLARH